MHPNSLAVGAGLSYTFWIHEKYAIPFDGDESLVNFFNTLGYSWPSIRARRQNLFNVLLNEDTFRSHSTTPWFYTGMAVGEVLDAAINKKSSEYLFRALMIFRDAIDVFKVPAFEVESICEALVKIHKTDRKSVWEIQNLNTSILNQLEHISSATAAKNNTTIYNGDVFIDVKNSTIVSRSNVENALNDLGKTETA